MPKKFEQPASPEELSKEFGELEQSLEEMLAGKYMEGEPMPTEAELREEVPKESVSETAEVPPGRKQEQADKYLEAKEQALREYSDMWGDYIQAKLAEGMTPEDIRDPGKLGYPKNHERYDEISGAFHEYFGPGDEFGMVDRIIEHVLSERAEEKLEEKDAREIIESLKDTPAGKYMEGEPMPTEVELEKKQRRAAEIAEKHFGKSEEVTGGQEDVQSEIEEATKWEAEQTEGWEHLMNLPRAQSPKGAETIRLLNQFSRKYGSQNFKTGRAMLPGQKYPKGEPGMIGVYVRREKLDEGEG